MWPSYGKFKTHVGEAHPEENLKALVKRSAVKPPGKNSRRRKMSVELESGVGD